VQWAVAIYPAYALSDGANGVNAGGGNDDNAGLVPEFAVCKKPPMVSGAFEIDLVIAFDPS
jgi:hypothetical protein